MNPSAMRNTAIRLPTAFDGIERSLIAAILGFLAICFGGCSSDPGTPESTLSHCWSEGFVRVCDVHSPAGAASELRNGILRIGTTAANIPPNTAAAFQQVANFSGKIEINDLACAVLVAKGIANGSACAADLAAPALTDNGDGTYSPNACGATLLIAAYAYSSCGESAGKARDLVLKVADPVLSARLSNPDVIAASLSAANRIKSQIGQGAAAIAVLGLDQNAVDAANLRRVLNKPDAEPRKPRPVDTSSINVASSSQLWDLVAVPDDASGVARFWIMNDQTGTVLDWADDDRAKVIVQQRMGLAPAQMWTLTPVGDGLVAIRNYHSGESLDYTSGNGFIPVILYDYKGAPAQHWRLIYEPNGKKRIVNCHTGLALSVTR